MVIEEKKERKAQSNPYLYEVQTIKLMNFPPCAYTYSPLQLLLSPESGLNEVMWWKAPASFAGHLYY